ncbi:MAG: hypothetical protein HQM10_23470 [Candidatus Riflebacteria bacterium]|nr:hypothetical protein [Candidatus Riflebacteria bacterium]
MLKNLIQKSIQMLSLETGGIQLPLDDGNILQMTTPWTGNDPKNIAWLTNRTELRKFSSEIGLETPEWYCNNSLQKLAEWCLKKQSFPYAIKSVQNEADAKRIFRVEGYKDLSSFFEKLSPDSKSEILIEKWVKGKYFFEVTCGYQKFELITQIGFRKDLTARTAWRTFPVKLPLSIKSKIDKITGKFESFLENPGKLLRFSFAIDDREITLISVNAGFNRLEYFPVWCGSNIEEESPVVQIFTGKTQKREINSKYMINFFRKNKRDESFPEKIPDRNFKSKIIKYDTSENYAAVLLESSDGNDFHKTVREIEFFLMG